MPKNIVLCFDGTGDWAGVDSTNVLRTFELLDKSVPAEQVVFYDGGVGTQIDGSVKSSLGQKLANFKDLAFATSLNDKVLAGYQFLVDHYERGDRIYMFGFSRGALTARVLSGFVRCFGILHARHRNLGPYLWQIFSDIPDGRLNAFKTIAAKLRRDFCSDRHPRIEYVGVWDTVNSVGILERFKTFPYTDFNPSIKNIRHAVSIDETRNVFPEALFNPRTPGLTEVWFPGVHRDVGGGGDRQSQKLSDVTLKWVLEGAARLAFLGTVNTEDVKPAFRGNVDPYALLGCYPMRMWNDAVHGFRTIWPNVFHRRPIPLNALVHRSAVGAEQYNPINLPKHPRLLGENAQPLAYLPESYLWTREKLVEHLIDFIGTVLGTVLVMSLCIGISGVFPWEFPTELTHVFWKAFLAYVLILSFAPKLDAYLSRFKHGLRSNSLAGIVVLTVLAMCPLILGASVHVRWQLADVGILGAGLWAFGQLPAGRDLKLPSLRADFILGCIGFQWFLVAVASRVLCSATDWYSNGPFRYGWIEKFAEGAALLSPSLGTGAFVAITLYGVAQLIADRMRIRATVERATDLARSDRFPIIEMGLSATTATGAAIEDLATGDLLDRMLVLIVVIAVIALEPTTVLRDENDDLAYPVNGSVFEILDWADAYLASLDSIEVDDSNRNRLRLTWLSSKGADEFLAALVASGQAVLGAHNADDLSQLRPELQLKEEWKSIFALASRLEATVRGVTLNAKLDFVETHSFKSKHRVGAVLTSSVIADVEQML